MSADSVRKLLRLAPDVRQPHAYQVFGLSEGEADVQLIRRAVEATIERLKSQQAETEPTVWKQAAAVVQQARAILADPKRKAELDARFGIISISDEEEPAASTPPSAAPPMSTAPGNAPPGNAPTGRAAEADDPLAGLLPDANPLAPWTPAATTVDAPASETVQPTPQQPALPVAASAASTAVEPSSDASRSSAGDGPAATSTAVMPVPVGAVSPAVGTRSSLRRRRRSLLPNLLLAFIAIGMTVAIVGLTYFLVFGPGQVAIRTGGNGIEISTVAPETRSPEVRAPDAPGTTPAAQPNRVRDPVMGTLPSRTADADHDRQSLAHELTVNRGDDDSPASPTVAPATDGAAMAAGASEMDEAPMDASAMDEAAMDEAPMDASAIDVGPSDPPASTEAAPAMEPAPTLSEPMPVPAADRQLAAAEQLIAEAKASVVAADWSGMKTRAEQAVAAAVTDEQRETAEAIFGLADLASFYRVGIERAIADLEVGNTFDVTESLTLSVVETGPEHLSVKFNGKTKSYAIDELPLVLAHRLATFQVTSGESTSIAAKAAYQAVTPVSTPQHRVQAVQWLQQIEEPIAGAEAEQLVAAIQMLFES